MPIATAAGPARTGPASATVPLAETARSLAGVHDTFAFAAAEPSGAGWTALSGVPEARVRAWLDHLTEMTGGHRRLAASYLVLRLTGCVATPPMAAFLLYQRGLPVDDERVSVHRDDDRFDLLALPAGHVDVLPGDPAAGHAHTVTVGDESTLADRLAERLYAVMAPIIDVVRQHARYGERPMWNSVADRLATPAVLAANVGGLDPHRCWQKTMSITDRLTALGAPVRRRPRLLEVPWSGGTAVGTVKGTCCLKYLEHDLRPRDAAEQPQEFCGGCPYVSDEARIAKRRAALEGTR